MNDYHFEEHLSNMNKMEECAINDQPIYLVWIREKYTIRLSMRYERGFTEVMFNEN
jgi:hypothetical protein